MMSLIKKKKKWFGLIANFLFFSWLTTAIALGPWRWEKTNPFFLKYFGFNFGFKNILEKGQPVTPSLFSEDQKIYQLNKITVAVIDSGLGGLAIMAEAAERLAKAKIYRQVNLIFFNALFSTQGGYNALPTREARLEMFDRVLNSLEKKIQPDLILIACNTLSALYPSTHFAHKTKKPVLDIIQPGINLISQQLKKEPQAVVIILGTPITISEDIHRQILLNQGFARHRLFTQACPELELFIERNPEGEETAWLISAYLNEALEKISKPWPPIILSLNCTHYGYSLRLWANAARENNLNYTIVNPNSGLVDLWLKPGLKARFPETQIKASCLSKVPINNSQKLTIATFLKKISPIIAEALINYQLEPRLF
ncbi:MAG: aspartate/glutamate racemase family protein [Candidatus Aminicenantes bacterium]|nr:aspartate/glutamate racemase family protein [Candidatus Aminicenantes bacterium]